MDIRNDFRLSFASDRNEIMTLNIPRANSTATGAQVAAAMAAIIDSGVVLSNRGEPRDIHGAELVRSERREFNIH